MREVDQKMLDIAISKVGMMTSDEALQIAIDAEQCAQECGPNDIATPQMLQQSRQFERYAYLLELAGH